MRVKVREVVDITAGVDTSKLKVLERFSIAIQDWYQRTSYYQNSINKQLDREARERTQREESLKGVLLKMYYNELVECVGAARYNAECAEVVLSVPRIYQETLEEILQHRDFDRYHITIEEPDPDLLLSFQHLPILVRASRRKGVELPTKIVDSSLKSDWW